MYWKLYFIIFILHGFFSAAQTSNWTAVLTAGSYQQSFNDFASTDEVTNYVRQKYTDDKKVLTDLVFANGRWHAVVSEKKGELGKQTWLFDSKIPNDWISEKWSKGFEIAKITYGNGLWFIYMMDDMNNRINTQSWAVRNSLEEIRAFIDKKYKEDSRNTIEDICFGNGSWFVVMSKENRVRTQTYNTSQEFPNSWIQEKYNNSYNITSAEFDGENWFFVATKLSTGGEGETIYNPMTIFPADKIKADWKEKKRITSLVFNNKTKSNAATDYSDLGSKALDNKDYYKAIEYFDQAIALGKADFIVYNNRAWAKYLTWQCEGALADVDESLKTKELDYNLHTKGSILSCLGRYREAINWFDKALAIHTRSNTIADGDYYGFRAEAKNKVGDYDGAKADLLEALNADPDNKDYKTLLKEIGGNLTVNTVPVISWDFPTEVEYVSTNQVIELSGCIKSTGALKGKWVSLNGNLVTAQTKDLTIEENCNMYIKSPVSLQQGKNEVFFYVETEAGQKGRSIKKTIYYQPKISNDNSYALLIANEKYNDPSINPLYDPSNSSFGPYGDATKLKEALVSKYGYADENVVVLRNANKSSIVQKLQYFKFISPNSNFLLMYSGHGDTLGRTGFWLPADAKLKQRETYFSNGELLDYLSNINAKHTLLLVDACFSGSIILNGSKSAETVECNIADQSRSFQALTSGANTRVANSSIFMNTLLQILNGSNNCMTSEKLYFLLKQNFLTQGFTAQSPQYGLLKTDQIQEGGHFTFFKH